MHEKPLDEKSTWVSVVRLSAGQQMQCDEQATQQRGNITYHLHTLSEVTLVEVIILEFLFT